MEFFHEPKIDWMGKKWYFIGLSIPLLVAGLVSIAWHRGLVYGIDFRGGTLVYVKFATPPNLDQIRARLDQENLHGATLQRADAAVLGALRNDFYLSSYAVLDTEIVGPKVGADLRQQALLVTLLGLGAMLVYIWFRFELIYGVAAVVATFHDVLITLGLFSILNSLGYPGTEITLTVIAALLTLVGYSMNDTIVVFDRIRENVRLNTRQNFSELVNRSINQTLSRTILASGRTFLAVLSLFL